MQILLNWCICCQILPFILFLVTISNHYYCFIFKHFCTLFKLVNFWLFLVHFFPRFSIKFYFLLPLPTLINPAFAYCLHWFSFWCKFYLIGAFVAKFCHLFYFWLSSITIVFIIFVNILQPLKLVVFLVIFGCIPNSNWLHFKYLFGVVLTNITTMLWIGNIIIPYFL